MGMWRCRAGSAVGWDWGDVFGEWSSECIFCGVDRESRVVFSSMRRVSHCRGTLVQKWLPEQVRVCPGLSVGWQVAVGYAVQLFWRQVQRASQWGRKCCVETVSLGHVYQSDLLGHAFFCDWITLLTCLVWCQTFLKLLECCEQVVCSQSPAVRSEAVSTFLEL